MAANIYDWSTTPASNSSSDSGINWAEGQAPSTVNNSARQLMGRVAEILSDLGGATAVVGTNTLTITMASAFTTLANGRMLAFKAVNDNTGAVTLNVNSIGAKAIVKMDSTGDVALVSGDIQATGIYVVRYSTALNGGAGAWLLSTPSTYVTLTGTQTLTNKTLTVPLIDGYKVGSVLLTSGTFTGATVDIVLTSYIAAGYTRYRLCWNGWQPVTDNATLGLRFSENAGSTYIATGYGGVALFIDGASPTVPQASAISVIFAKMSDNTGNAANETSAGYIDLDRGTVRARYRSFSHSVDGVPQHQISITGGHCLTTAVFDAIRMLPSSGNHNAGSYTLYGFKES